MQTEISQLKNRLGIVGSHHNVSHHLPPLLLNAEPLAVDDISFDKIYKNVRRDGF